MLTCIQINSSYTPASTHFMRTVIQRVKKCTVFINNQETSAIASGLLVLLGIEDTDTPDDLLWLAQKIVNLRIFSDDAGLMNLSVGDIGGDILVVSQFTLFASTRKGNRPSFIRSAKPDIEIGRASCRERV